MSGLPLIKGVSKVWDRIFDQKGFLDGEINFFLKHFELERGDKEVENLFKSIEILTDINSNKETDQVLKSTYSQININNEKLIKSLVICDKIQQLEPEYKKNQIKLLTEQQDKNKEKWVEIMNDVHLKYDQINSNFEEKKLELIKKYKEMESKLK